MDDGKRQNQHAGNGRSDRSLRHAVAIPAVIIGKESAPVDCEIRDLSSTGMCLAVQLYLPDTNDDPLAAGREAHVAFAPDPDQAPADKISLPVQIMRRHPTGVGIRYLERSDQLNTALKTAVRSTVDARVVELAGHHKFTPVQQRKILGACRKTLEKLLPNIIWALRTDLSRRLRLYAEDAAPDDGHKARAEADEIDERASAIGRTIEVGFFRRFAEAVDLDQTQELKFADLTAHRADESNDGGLEFVGDQTIEHAAVITALAHVAEERYKSKLFELNIRLKDVVGHRMDNELNPLYPSAVCRTFWEATIEYCDSPRIRRQLRAAISERVVPLLGEIYDELHKTMNAHDVPSAFDH